MDNNFKKMLSDRLGMPEVYQSGGATHSPHP